MPKPQRLDQSSLIAQIEAYAPLPFNNTAGICAGLVQYWLYRMRYNREADFLAEYNYILNSKPKPSSGNLGRDNTFDEKIENFLNNVLFLHHDMQLRPGIDRHEMDKSFALILDPKQTQIEAEFSISFVFNREKLSSMLKECVHENKMIMVGNEFHVIGLYYRNGIYHVFDPNSPNGPEQVNDLRKVSDAIFKALTPSCHSKSHIAINMSVFELANAAAAVYPNKSKYYNYTKEILNHPNIARVGLRYDREMLNNLFSHGYRYVKSELYPYSELIEVLSEKNYDKAKYLLAHNFPINWKPKHGVSALQMAIFAKDPEAVVLLLAAGAELDRATLFLMSIRFGFEELRNIKSRALELNAKMLHLDDRLEFSSLVANEHLKISLAAEPNVVELTAKTIDKIVDSLLKKDLAQLDREQLEKIAIIVSELKDLGSKTFCMSPQKMYLSRKANLALHKINKYLEAHQIQPDTSVHYDILNTI